MAESPQENSAAQTPSDDGNPQRRKVAIDESKLVTSYANFCRVTGTPEELIVDFGLNTQPMGVPTQPMQINQRIVTNFYTAKRLLHALQMALQRHEQTFGPLEIDVQKRVVGGKGKGS